MRILPALEHLSYRYPSVLVDAVTHHEPGQRIVAVKNVTVNEEFFQGHFPGTPLMPGVLMIESLTQVASLLLFAGAPDAERRGWLRGVDGAKFRRQVVPGDRLELSVTMGKRRGGIAKPI
jgi:beta-hydroxyacyl-ACP dehydratase FabZ